MPRVEGTLEPGGIYRPILIINVEANGRAISGPAVVDSGADRTIFPVETLQLLGIDWDALPASGDTQQGAGGGFEARELPGRVTYREWEVCSGFLVAEPASGLPHALLGRDDFFAKFTVKFNWNQKPPNFYVEWVVPAKK